MIQQRTEHTSIMCHEPAVTEMNKQLLSSLLGIRLMRSYTNPTPTHEALARVQKLYRRTNKEENKILFCDSFLYSFLVDRF